MANNIRIAILGCGKQAPKHISGLRSVPGVEVLLADVYADAARRLAEKENLAWVEHPDQVFSDSTIDAVDICTPTPSHAELIRAAIRSGKDFFCEKPLCQSSAEAQEIADELHSHKRIGMVGYVYRFAPVFELGKQLFYDVPETGISEVLGPIRFAILRIGGRGSHQLWKHLRSAGGGAVNEMLVHMLDLALWYFGPVRNAQILGKGLLRASREIQGKLENVDAEDYVVTELEMKSGVTVLCQADLLTPAFTQFIEIQGDNGTFMGSIDPAMPSFVFCTKQAGTWKEGRNCLEFNHVNLFEAQMSAFVQAIQTRSELDRGSVNDSVQLLKTMEMLQAEFVGA